MKKLCLTLGCGLVAFGLCLSAEARPQYANAVKALTAATQQEKDLQAKVKADNCNACHMGPDKKVRNEYGMKLGKLLPKFEAAKWKDKEADAKKELQDAINKVQ